MTYHYLSMPTLVYIPMTPSYTLLCIQFLIVKHFRMISILYLNGPPELTCTSTQTKVFTCTSLVRTTLCITILFYKTIYNLIEISPDDLTPSTRGHDQRFHNINVRKTQYSNFFFPRSVRFWNTLPQGLIHQQSL